MNPWRAGCSGTGTSGSEGGPGKRTGRKTGTAPRVDPYIERLNKEIKRRTNVVGIFPNPAALTRLTGAVLIEIHEEWAATERRYLSEASMAALSTAAAPALASPGAEAPHTGARTEELAGVSARG